MEGRHFNSHSPPPLSGESVTKKKKKTPAIVDAAYEAALHAATWRVRCGITEDGGERSEIVAEEQYARVRVWGLNAAGERTKRSARAIKTSMQS